MKEMTEDVKIKIENRAQALVNSMAKRDFRVAGDHFTSTMTSLLPANKIEEMWNVIEAKDGAFVEQVAGAVEINGEGVPLVILLCKFEKGNHNLFITFDWDCNVSGIHIAPAPVKAPAQPAT